ncbi:hypothetical protein MRB53_012894 [Persea americana]|uniref:Uncharacterized protein n=1 Tax=Persea americana TaxID=3435 RepID=A0ACC2M0A0_PERAE|nr:hypothetical protein MRB53_012894 [Persea americana]
MGCFCLKFCGRGSTCRVEIGLHCMFNQRNATLISVRGIPWAKTHLSTTAQALIISAGTSQFIVAYSVLDKNVLPILRKQLTSMGQANEVARLVSGMHTIHCTPL